MSQYSEEFVEGWKAARAQYQAKGGVEPYPPGYKPNPMNVATHGLNIKNAVHETTLRDEQIPEDSPLKKRVRKVRGE